ncbi:MAG: response regulator transcription factor [Gammaproteobacteria bacterium]|nr:response regulator transcription factor [Gammaproteobacteria bacterium]MXY55049.1 response regulator transcription factor [Gammaproteobacteria bacterium]MYF30779.1 response regulator transcription factor [Gammaproteobacteria bacterium]MYK48496.1 response regulator transcription factor [Gammaproteobacteria bacterium]
MRILLVEDDSDLAEAVRRLLRREGHVVDLADSLRMARAAITEHPYELVLLDRMLPDGEGTALIFHAREAGVRTRFLILSALGDIQKRVEGLDLGADDYIVKPFEPDELCARIRAVGRRPTGDAPRSVEFGNLRLDRASRDILATTDGETEARPVVLPRRELTLLQTLLERAGRVVTRDSLESAMYGYDDLFQSNTLESHVSRLRKHLAETDARVAIHTIRGVGYMLKEQP